MTRANSVVFLTVLLSLSCLSVVLGQGSCDADPGNEGPTCDFQCDAGSYLIDCGDENTDKASCKSKGCCWNPYLPPTSPKCFQKNGGYAFCDNSRDRVLCAKSDEDISKENCEKRSCCYDASRSVSEGRCYFHNTNYDPSCPFKERIQCGTTVDTKDACVKLGCCWSKSSCALEPSCFLPTSKLNQLKKDLNPDATTANVVPPSPPKVVARSALHDEL